MTIVSICLVVQLIAVLSYFCIGSLGQQCLTLANNKKDDRLKNSCVGVVDYDYFLPPDFTADSLRDVAMAQLSNSAFKGLPPECQSAFNTMVCANVYKKCYDGINLADPATYNGEIYLTDTGFPFRVPFYRPCQSVCTNVHSACQLSLFGYLNQLPNCNATLDVSNGAAGAAAESIGVYNLTDPYQYDRSNDESTCYVPAYREIASNMEEYRYKDRGACAGLVDVIFPANGRGFDDSYALLQGPHDMQEEVEKVLRDGIGSLPVFMEKACYAALRRKLCATAFLEPYVSSLEEVYVDDDQADRIAAAKGEHNSH